RHAAARTVCIAEHGGAVASGVGAVNDSDDGVLAVAHHADSGLGVVEVEPPLGEDGDAAHGAALMVDHVWWIMCGGSCVVDHARLRCAAIIARSRGPGMYTRCIQGMRVTNRT